MRPESPFPTPSIRRSDLVQSMRSDWRPPAPPPVATYGCGEAFRLVKVGTVTRDDEIAALYASHARRARALAFLLTGDQAVAEDLVQACFLRLGSRVRPVRES